MRKLTLLLVALATTLALTAAKPVEKKYLAGAVPEVDGQVIFQKAYTVPGKPAADILALAQSYVQSQLVEGPEHGNQARITEISPDAGVLAASIQETLWFLRKPMRSDFCQFYYQVVCEAKDGQLMLTLRNLRYVYELTERAEDIATFRAEEWITDKEALSKNGTKLARMTGKFRKATIDRKDDIVQGLGQALGATPQAKTVIVEEY